MKCSLKPWQDRVSTVFYMAVHCSNFLLTSSLCIDNLFNQKCKIWSYHSIRPADADFFVQFLCDLAAFSPRFLSSSQKKHPVHMQNKCSSSDTQNHRQSLWEHNSKTRSADWHRQLFLFQYPFIVLITQIFTKTEGLLHQDQRKHGPASE